MFLRGPQHFLHDWGATFPLALALITVNGTRNCELWSATKIHQYETIDRDALCLHAYITMETRQQNLSFLLCMPAEAIRSDLE